jgi:hypothetical protein
MATPTYTLIDSRTLASSATSVEFTSIDQSYGDLVLVLSATSSAGANRSAFAQFNSDAGSNYSEVLMIGDGSSPSSSTRAATNIGVGVVGATSPSLNITSIMDYSATDKQKTLLSRQNNTELYTIARAGRWASTSAITSIYLFPNSDQFATGSTFFLYGIAKAL